MKTLSKAVTVVLGIGLFVTACDNRASSPLAGPDAPDVAFARHIDNTGNRLPVFESLEVCKDWVGGSALATTFDVTTNNDVDNAGSQTTVPRVLNDASADSSQCREVLTFDGTAENGPTDFMSVVENQPAGTQLVSIVAVAVDNQGNQLFSAAVSEASVTDSDGPISLDWSAGSFTATQGDNKIGYLVTFTNELIPVEGGGEGCTPGYWRNHAGPYSWSKGGQKKPSSWEGFSPTDGYDAVFGVASTFGGTLIEAVVRGGGGENALGRHAVAALLNAASADVSYDLSVADVIQTVQDAYSSGDFEGAKNELAVLNEQGCPL